jgi:CubicO group peptidase (beta-lactamase class C family)
VSIEQQRVDQSEGTFSGGCCFLMLLWGCLPAHADVAAAATLAGELERGGHAGIESFILKTDGEIAGRYVSPRLSATPPDLRSATKSITSLLVGIAIDRGELASVRAAVADLLPEYRDVLSKDPQKARITVEDLLTMRSGLDCDDSNEKSPGHEDKMYRQRDWVALPELNAICVTTGTRFNRPDALEPLFWLKDRILPGMSGAAAGSPAESR